MGSTRFDNAFIRELPGEADAGPGSRQVQGAAWSAVGPSAVAAPRLLAWTEDLARQIGIDTCVPADLRAQVFAGNTLVEGMQPWASNYGGHQFGHWAGQLGDGRAISLGEAVNANGERFELQLKGAGPTPYSRGSDGRAVLRSSVREFLCSEAMHHLGVPTTRALSLVQTGDAVVRDMFYDGRPESEPGAVVCRVAPSFIRFGNFELPASRGDIGLLRQLVDFTIRRDFPQLATQTLTDEQRIAAWFAEVCHRSAEMVAHWMRVGFVHGVMNTDNMSILGLTIDYGPYGWIDSYDPDWTPNTTDREQRRYRFGQQPQIVGWNLTRLAGALLQLVASEEPLQEGLNGFVAGFEAADRRHSADKLGLREADEAGLDLMQRLRVLLHRGEIDMTLFFRQLGSLDIGALSPERFSSCFYTESGRSAVAEPLQRWLEDYVGRVGSQGLEAGARSAQMNAVNPRYVLRNYLAQQAIDAATQGDLSVLHRLQEVLRDPYADQAGSEALAGRRPEWARDRAGCSMLSCSS